MSLSLREIQAYPKIDFDRHIDGSIPKGVVRRIAQQMGIHSFRLRTGELVSLDNEDEFDSFYQIHSVSSFDELLSRFDLILAIMQTPEAIEEICYEAMLDVASKNIWYVEWVLAPAYHTRDGLDYDTILRSALMGIERGYQDTGVIGKLIPSINREAVDKKKPEDKEDPLGLNLVDAVLRLQHTGIAALGLVCNEGRYPPELYEKAFKLAITSSLRRSIHAGEIGNQRSKNVITSLELLGADGIVHGVPIGGDETLIAMMVERQTRHVVHPWSNIYTGAIESVADLHIDTLLDRGVLTSIHSDDPILFGQELAHNLQLVLDHYNWGLSELELLTRNSINTAFVNEKERTELFKLLRKKGAML